MSKGLLRVYVRVKLQDEESYLAEISGYLLE